MADPVDELLDAFAAFAGVPKWKAPQREQLRKALKRWVKREVRDHALSGEQQ